MSRREASAAKEWEYEVTPGDDQDVCPRCGIWRMNAGWTKDSCGPHFRKPGCFIPLVVGRPEQARKRGGTVPLHD